MCEFIEQSDGVRETGQKWQHTEYVCGALFLSFTYVHSERFVGLFSPFRILFIVRLCWLWDKKIENIFA